MSTISFGLLDFGYRDESMGSRRIQMDTIEYAGQADTLGFTRYWLAEHYFKKRRLAWTNPEPLLPLLASMTKRIKIGTAGILLGIHQPFHVAAYFKFLNNFFPNRIDLGVANGVVPPIISKNTVGIEDMSKLRESFHCKFQELLDYLRKEDELFEGEEGIVIPPYKGLIPEVWSLSVSNHGLKRALDLKVNFARSVFHRGADLSPEKERLVEFNEQYQQKHGILPKVTLAISGCCQETDKQARSLTAALNFDQEQNIVCSINEFYDKIMSYRETFGVNEFIFKDIARKPEDRIRTLELISDKFGLLNSSSSITSMQALPAYQ